MDQNASTLQPINPQTPRDPDEINLLEYVYAIVKHKWLIIGLTVLGIIAGYIAALVKGPTWVAEVMIAPRETESQKTPSFAGLGALGGIVASQLSLGGNASLDKIDLILDSREFGAKLIDHYSLLPIIYKYQWPKIYQKSWDILKNTWKVDFNKPPPLDMGSFIRSKYLKKISNKNNTMTLQIKSSDSTFSINLANNYIEYLNDYIKSSVQTEAHENVSYLEKQLVAISDPLLREKIQGLIANEIEKEMVVSKEAFKIVDPVYLSKNFKHKKLYPIVFAAGLFFLTVLLVVFLYAFSSADKTEEDKQLLNKIRKEIFLGQK
jgi:hypothetical protein